MEHSVERSGEKAWKSERKCRPGANELKLRVGFEEVYNVVDQDASIVP